MNVAILRAIASRYSVLLIPVVNVFAPLVKSLKNIVTTVYTKFY